jgi:Dynamin family
MEDSSTQKKLTELLNHARTATESFSQWFEDKVAPLAATPHPFEYSSWRKELVLIRALVDDPDRVRIALIGTTGAGKSSLLNAILGQEILPVGVMEPCTAFVTTVSHSSDPGYYVKVSFCTREEWRTDLDTFISALQPGDTSEDGDGRIEGKRLMDAARKRIQAVYEMNVDDDFDPVVISKKPLPRNVERIFKSGSLETFRFDDAKEMLGYLRQLIRGESPLWPLLKQVGITGPYDCLTGGLELVDLPGLNDPNAARVEVTRGFLRTSPFVWVIFSMVRGLTKDIHEILGEEKLLRNLVLSGTYHALSLIGTRADDIDHVNSDQLGLSDDCTTPELISAYRQQTVSRAKEQLEELVSDLALESDRGETLSRMVAMARTVKVHTTSANAYCKLKKIGRFRKDYGIDEVYETGIPDIHDHLTEIARDSGAGYNAQTALNRLDQLRDEVAFFFRAKVQTLTPEMEQARTRLQRERDDFGATIQLNYNRAIERLKVYREGFLGKMEPLLATSGRGVQRAIEGWRGIHWGTLRAVVRNDGSFKSPTTGRSFDLNEDLAEPLLSQLPVTWEQYFTDDLGRVTGEFVIQITESGKSFCDKVHLITDLLLKRQDDRLNSQLAWFQDKVSLLAQSAKDKVFAAVRERRSELAAKMPLVAKGRMQPAYGKSKGESGSGMKRRILSHVEPVALESAQPIFSTIQIDLLEGLKDLEIILTGMFRGLTQAAEDQARIVAHNANIDVDEAAIDPTIADLLKSVPKIL